MRLRLIGLILFAWLFSRVVFASEALSSWPVVLVHGLMGFNGEMLQKNYWGDVPEFLQENGATVLVADLSAAHETKVRGQQLYAQLKQWGYNKYHIIGHSQGGKDARFILHMDPDIVASITTIATPHRGSPVADFLYTSVEAMPLISQLLWRMGDLLGCLLGVVSHNYKDIEKSSQDIKLQVYDTSRKIRENLNLSCIINKIKNILFTTKISDIIENARMLCPLISTLVTNTSTQICQAMNTIYCDMKDQDAKNAIRCLTTGASEEFNAECSAGISSESSACSLYSWGTHSVCRLDNFDILGLSMQMTSRLFFGAQENDGVVALDSMKFGLWLGELSGGHHLVAANKGLGSFRQEHIDWFRSMFLMLFKRIEEDCQKHSL